MLWSRWSQFLFWSPIHPASFPNPFGTVPSIPPTIVIIVTTMIHNFFSSLEKFKYLANVLLSFFLSLSKKRPALFFFLINGGSGLLARIWWFLCISKYKGILCVSFYSTDSTLSIYHLLIWWNFSFLHNSQWITFSTHSCLFLYTFYTRLLRSVTMGLIDSLLSSHILYLLF